MYPMQVTLTISNEEQFKALAAVITGAVPATATAAPKTTKPKAEKQVEPPPAQEKAPETKPETEQAAPAGKTTEDARQLVLKLVPAKGRDAAVALLTKYGAKLATEVKPEDLDAFCKEAEEALAK